jgi:hypothetical protein
VRGVGNPSEWWSPRDVIDVVADIESGEHRYVVLIPGFGVSTVATTDSGLLRALTAAGEELLSELPAF